MVNWFDLMRQAQDGRGLENFARQFGLSQQQVNAAVAALMPAFAMGFQRAATDPSAMAQLFRVMTGGHFPNFWESANQAFTPQARQEGKHLLDQLFGSDEVSRRVAHQAASFSGVGVDVLHQMLPLLAGIMAGGIAKLATGQGAMLSAMAGGSGAGQAPRSQSGGGQAPRGQSGGGQAASGQTGAGSWADLWGQWMGAGARPEQKPEARPKPPPAPEPSQQASANPFEEMMASFLRASAPPRAEPRPPEPQAERPEPKSEPKPEPEAAPEPPPQAPAAEAPDALQAWGEMMEKGHEMQRQYLESLQSIFNEVWGRGQGRPGK
jgi:hypothetical protein